MSDLAGFFVRWICLDSLPQCLTLGDDLMPSKIERAGWGSPLHPGSPPALGQAQQFRQAARAPASASLPSQPLICAPKLAAVWLSPEQLAAALSLSRTLHLSVSG